MEYSVLFFVWIVIASNQVNGKRNEGQDWQLRENKEKLEDKKEDEGEGERLKEMRFNFDPKTQKGEFISFSIWKEKEEENDCDDDN